MLGLSDVKWEDRKEDQPAHVVKQRSLSVSLPETLIPNILVLTGFNIFFHIQRL